MVLGYTLALLFITIVVLPILYNLKITSINEVRAINNYQSKYVYKSPQPTHQKISNGNIVVCLLLFTMDSVYTYLLIRYRLLTFLLIYHFVCNSTEATLYISFRLLCLCGLYVPLQIYIILYVSLCLPSIQTVPGVAVQECCLEEVNHRLWHCQSGLVYGNVFVRPCTCPRHRYQPLHCKFHDYFGFHLYLLYNHREFSSSERSFMHILRGYIYKNTRKKHVKCQLYNNVVVIKFLYIV